MTTGRKFAGDQPSPARCAADDGLEVTTISSTEVVLTDANKTTVRIANDVVFSMLRREAPLDFLAARPFR